jgi:hypothetical protein
MAIYYRVLSVLFMKDFVRIVPPQFATNPLELPSFARRCDRGIDCAPAPLRSRFLLWQIEMLTGPVYHRRAFSFAGRRARRTMW